MEEGEGRIGRNYRLPKVRVGSSFIIKMYGYDVVVFENYW